MTFKKNRLILALLLTGFCLPSSLFLNSQDKQENPMNNASEKLIFEDTFDQKNENWVLEKWHDEEGTMALEDGKLKLTTIENKEKKLGVDGIMVWLKKELPKNFKFECDVTPTSKSGFFLLFFCIKRQDGKDILSPEILNEKMGGTLFKKYTSSSINGYHISYRRNEAANCNLRKNSGMELLHQTILEKNMPKDKTVHLVLTKKGGHIRMTIDDTVFMDFTDDGSKNGSIREGGRIGFRQVYESSGFYDNVKLYDLDK